MNIYKKQLLNRRTIGNIKQSTVQVSRSDEKPITLNELLEISNSIQDNATEKDYKKFKYMIRGLLINNWTTIKGFQTDLDIDGIEDYLVGLVKETGKFKEIIQLQITTFFEK
jgi:hypothetical protein